MIISNIAICEDMDTHAQALIGHVHRFFDENHALCKIIRFKDGKSLADNFKPDLYSIVFMDIFMDERNSDGMQSPYTSRSGVGNVANSALEEDALDLSPLQPTVSRTFVLANLAADHFFETTVLHLGSCFENNIYNLQTTHSLPTER